MIVLAACGGASEGELARTYDPCAPLALAVGDEATADEASGVAGAVALWRGAGVTGFDANAGEAGSSDTIAIHFQMAASTFHGLYDAATGIVYINQDLVDPGTIAIVVAHELGHGFGLVHVTDRTSLMNPGNLATPPTDGDRAAIAALWGTCP